VLEGGQRQGGSRIRSRGGRAGCQQVDDLGQPRMAVQCSRQAGGGSGPEGRGRQLLRGIGLGGQPLEAGQ
jgi:hypothetical protein